MKRAEYTAFVFAHFALFVIFVWFGALKIFALSPANPLVSSLLSQTMPFLSFETFSLGLGIYEVLIGLFFIIPRKEKIALVLLVPHMVVTVIPLLLLPSMTWQSPFVPTLEGQYIIKNIVIIALAAMVFVDLKKKRFSQC